MSIPVRNLAFITALLVGVIANTPALADHHRRAVKLPPAQSAPTTDASALLPPTAPVVLPTDPVLPPTKSVMPPTAPVRPSTEAVTPSTEAATPAVDTQRSQGTP